MGSFFREVHRFRLLVVVVAVGLLVVGGAQLRKAPVDVLPEFSPTYAEIQTEALGLSAEEVEQLITVPLEANLLNGVEGVRTIRSESVPGLSSIVMLFQPGTDTYQARQLVEERLTQAHSLPKVSKPPTLLQPRSSSNRVLAIEMSSEQVSDLEMSVVARWTVRPRLLGVPGVANVAIWGLRDQQLQVQVDPAVLKAKGVTLDQVVRSSGNAQVVSPLSFLEASTPGNGGFIETPQQRLQVRHVLEKLADPAELGRVPVHGTNGRLRLSDVATITIDHQPLIGDAQVDGRPGLLLLVEKFPGAGTAQVTEDVESALEQLGPGLAGIRTDTTLLRPATYVEDATRNVTLALGIALLLGLAVLGAMRVQWRAVLIALFTVPVSVVTSAVVLRLLGESINALVVAGLAVAVAVMLDDAVVLTQRVMRTLRGRSAAAPEEDGLPGRVSRSVHPVMPALTYALVIGLLVIAPVVAMGGRPGDFFAPLVLSYGVALLVSMAVAVTVAPVLAAILFRGWHPEALPSPAESVYAQALQRFGARARTAVIAAVACAVAGVAALPFLDRALLPAFEDRNLVVRLEAAPGTSSERTSQLATDLGRRLEDVSGVDRVGSYVGRAVTGDRVVNVSSSDVWVSIDPDADYDDTVEAVERAAAQVTGASTQVLSYTTQKMRDVGALHDGENRVGGSGIDVLTGTDEPLAVRVYGENAAILQREAERIRKAVADVDGATRPLVDVPAAQATIEIEVDLQKAQAYGITPGDVRRTEAVLLHGIQVGSVFEQQKVFDVVVVGVPSVRESVADVRNLLVDLPTGGQVRLGQVADVRVSQRPAVIRREAVSRYVDVLVPVSGRSVGAVATDLQAVLDRMAFPLEYHAEVVREDTANELGTGRMWATALTVLLGIYLLLQAAFRSWRLAALAVLSAPLALAGGLVAAAVTGGDVTLGTLLGLLVVLVLSVRASLLLITSAQAEAAGLSLSFADRVRLASTERLAPVLATSGVLAVLALPFVVLGARPGLEILHPMAVAVLGGLVTSAVATLLLLPAWCMHTGPAPEPAPAAAVEDDVREPVPATAAKQLVADAPRTIDVTQHDVPEPQPTGNGQRPMWDDGSRL